MRPDRRASSMCPTEVAFTNRSGYFARYRSYSMSPSTANSKSAPNGLGSHNVTVMESVPLASISRTRGGS